MGVVLNVAGWCGGVAVVVAYVLVTTRRISAEARTFQVLNVIGGVLLTGTALQRGAIPNTVINLVWITFGVYALTTAHRARRRSTSEDSPPAAPPDAEHRAEHRAEHGAEELATS